MMKYILLLLLASTAKAAPLVQPQDIAGGIMVAIGTATVFFTSVTSAALVFGFSATIGGGQVMYHCVGWK